MNKFSYGINGGWGSCVDTPTSIGKKFIRTLDEMSRADPALSDWRIFETEDAGVPLEAARSRIARIVADNVKRDDFGQPCPTDGYEIFAATLEGRIPTPRDLVFYVGAGSRWDINKIQLDAAWVDEPLDLSAVTYSVFNGAMTAITSIWPCAWATAYAYDADYEHSSPAPGGPLIRWSLSHMPWISYLSAPLARGLEPPPEVEVEPAPDGGLFMIVTKDRFDPENPDQLARSKLISDIMIERFHQL
jgi:hypothetical protein